MAVESAADRAAFVNSDEFGKVAVYTTITGRVYPDIDGILDKGFAEAGTVEGVGVASTEPRFTCRTADLPSEARDGDQLVVDGVTYTVKVRELDDTGDMTELVLQET